jgi:Ca-activated chloride channel family protein
VKLYTVAVGREGGTVARVQGQDYFIPFDPKSLEQLAQLSPGKHVFPPTKESMSSIYQELGTVIKWEATKLEVSGLLSGLAVALMLVGGGLSLRWQRRVP